VGRGGARGAVASGSASVRAGSQSAMAWNADSRADSREV